MRQPILFDGRNLLRPGKWKSGFIYYSVGRPEVFPELETKTRRVKRRRKIPSSAR